MDQLTFRFKHVVIIDDSATDVLILKEIMQSLRYAEFITTFENPVSAWNFIKRCEQKLPDLIFIDLSMPGIGGFEFIERFKREFSKKTKFIITTSSDDPSDIETSSRYSNIINYFIKPVHKLDLMNIE